MTFRAEEASAIAAFASAVTAYFSYRTAKKVMHGEVAPFLVGEYAFDDPHVPIKNVGRGPALNISLQRTHKHYVDIKIIEAFELEEGQRTVNSGDYLPIAFRLKGTKSTNEEDKKYTNFSIIELAKEKELGLIYEDVYGKKWITKLKVVRSARRNDILETRRIRRYTRLYAIWDVISSWYFKFGKFYRETKYRLGIKNAQ